ncbi:predicted protein [Nematostella vectensis]|uniref:WGR domain-containing protein n=1 Tax=Nematostella vectensis TaxID=45351 RepID=A7T240_NEMVE|nr:predicted protein [Nematostella vectensis]|eukprot:XP_001622076.1 hypothetical protein NEMVEDRAFT_v1g248572 [Nematostella vectensis]
MFCSVKKHSSKLHVGEPEPGFNLTTSRDAFWDGEEPDVDADAAAMLAEVKDANEEPEYDPAKPPPVDPVTNKQKTGSKVFMKPATGIPYDILMTKVDVKYGYFGLNNFYKMQVIFEKGKNLWVLLTRWGRIGDRGQHQLTPFSDAKAATDEFKKIFRSKTGNLWDEKGSFVKHPKKYSLVLPERNPQFHHRKPKDILKPFDLEACPPSKLPKPLQTLMKAITDQEWLRKSVSHHSLQVDPEFMPFGRLSLETINRARGVLEKICKRDGYVISFSKIDDYVISFSKIDGYLISLSKSGYFVISHSVGPRRKLSKPEVFGILLPI